MSNYKYILLYADETVSRHITESSNIAGIRFNTVSDSTDFNLGLDSHPDGIIISSEIMDDFVLASLANSGTDALIAAVVSQDDHETISRLMSYNITTFIPQSMMCIHAGRFADQVLLSEKKNKVVIKALKRLRNLVGNVNEGVIIMDDNSHISYSNKAAEEMLGMDKKELLRKEINDIFLSHPYPIGELADKPVYIDNFKLETYKGKKLAINSTYSANIEDDKFAGAVIIMNEVSSYYMDKQKELELLKYQQRYHSSQQNLAFKKQMLIMKDEVSNIVAGNYRIETYFKPLDVLSGDIYGSINIGDGRYLFYVIDAMGKGLSASVTALQSTSFINHSLELSLLKLDFDLTRTISSFLHYIRDRLMDEEALCVVFALLDTNLNKLSVVNYGMPPVQLLDTEKKLITIRPNNLPIMRYVADKNMDTYDLTDIDKIMIMSDGIIETQTITDELYMDYLKEDFTAAVTKKHMLSLMARRIASNDDDITFFFISRSGLDKKYDLELSIESDLKQITGVSNDLTERMTADGIGIGDIGTIEYAFSEIIMNALEHGNLGLGYDEKQMLIEQGIYDEYLMKNTDQDSPFRQKKIHVSYSFVKNCGGHQLVVIKVQDEGQGFIPANLFKFHSFDGNLCHIDKTSYNGRGIFITDTLIDGLYYNEHGNCAYLVKLIEN